MVRVTALMDNKGSENKALIHEHGLSFLIERPDCRILFDCGAGGHPWDNAYRLGRGLEGLDAVVLSHSHYDHAAGYRDLLDRGLGSRLLYTGPHFFEPKFAFDGVLYTDLSVGFDEAFLRRHGVERRVVTDVTEIAPGIHLICGFPRTHDFETIPSRFVRLTENGFVPDDFADELCLAMETGGGLVVLVGCSHPGILNMMDRVHRSLGKPISAVYGGTHLNEADDSRIDATIAELRAMGLETLGLSHCSGDRAEERLCCGDAKGGHMAAGDCVFFQ